MCGFVGIHKESSGILEEEFISLRDKLKHRGPDGAGLWKNKKNTVFLGHRRLSIIDLSDNGLQPMVSANSRFTIVFNGEIFNYKEIKLTLLSLGYKFRTETDTEVLLAAYECWGGACLERLNGMFSFVVYDQGDRTHPEKFFLCRDRVGEKPLYYSFSNKIFQFASELKAIKHNNAIDFNALNHYLARGYIPSNKTLFQNVHKLEPGHYATYEPIKNKFDIQKYWDLPRSEPSLSDSGSLINQTKKLLEDSVRLRMTSDVPVGVLLSGGLDSSLIAAAAVRSADRPIQTFSVSIANSQLDESKYARKVSEFLGTTHNELTLDVNHFELFDGSFDFIDEPLADSSILPSFLIYRAASKEVKVALGGDGGDELFGGYTGYKQSLLDVDRFRKIPKKVFLELAHLAKYLPGGFRGRNKLFSFLDGPEKQLIWGTPYFDGYLRKKIFTDDVLAFLGDDIFEPENQLSALYEKGSDIIDSLTRMHFYSDLPDDFLFKVDRASMASGIEIRSPFLDHKLIEFSFSAIPSSYKVNRNETRILEKLIAHDWLPADLDVNRKQGFSIPINDWLRSLGVNQVMTYMEYLPDCIRLDEVETLVRLHQKGFSNGGRIFSLIMLSLTMKNLVEA